ncbi:MAG: Ni/Fe-hydrogenase cytochrome b subunit [Deferribacteraceae bacterium]|jgi:Ni/Fe-hydrogenase subunit HybB-like protein|nr:Ni/Fe-hydrogenase cytochrome b subunit [Deferribacteraceae bacterium]
MSHHEEYVEAPGKLITRTTVTLALIVCAAFAVIAYRYIFGIGPISNLSDGYPWGVWLAYDVSLGTAFACGGYALAFLCYIFNGWKYHPMIRSAVVASMFGYALAGFSVLVDIGRYWNAYGFFVPSRWQPNSVMFEVALCVMAYTVILIIEFAPSLLEKIATFKSPLLSGIAEFILPKLDKAMIFIIALGMTLPTMHQSSLGSLLYITGHKLHPLWQTGALPLLFVTNAMLLGFSIVVFESSLSALGFKRPYEYEALEIARFIPIVAIFWLAVRFIDLIIRGQVVAMFTSGFHSVFFWAEIILIVTATVRFLRKPGPKAAFYTALMMCFGGGFYRMSVYLIGFNPGDEWNVYFPSIPEAMITYGLIALEILGYILLARLLKQLPKPHAKGAH